MRFSLMNHPAMGVAPWRAGKPVARRRSLQFLDMMTLGRDQWKWNVNRIVKFSEMLSCLINPITMAGWWFGCHQFYCPIQLGMSSSQLTFIFLEGFKPPTRQLWIWRDSKWVRYCSCWFVWKCRSIVQLFPAYDIELYYILAIMSDQHVTLCWFLSC